MHVVMDCFDITEEFLDDDDDDDDDDALSIETYRSFWYN